MRIAKNTGLRLGWERGLSIWPFWLLLAWAGNGLVTAPTWGAVPAQELPTLEVRTDDTVVDHSCRIVIAAGAVIADANGNGVIHVRGDGLRVEFVPGSVLRGAASGTPGDQLEGIGIHVAGSKGVVLRGLNVSGFKVGLRAVKTPALQVLDSHFSDNFRQRLRSTRDREDPSDWLVPGWNDAGEWCERYGAAVSVANSDGVKIEGVQVRRGQNGILLQRVAGSQVRGNDCSFLSGWGIALWRSSGNRIESNQCDFCIRGYSHDNYNRGQDSAGFLFFEQCSNNWVEGNSATHCGDGFFGFSGREALGQAGDAELPRKRRGNNDNVLFGNDFSYAAAHGIEMTFGFGNQIWCNTLRGNAICGVWGGYSQDTVVAANWIEGNGAQGYGLERGGINIEHGSGNLIWKNQFRGNRCAIHLWSDDDPELLQLPWSRVNHRGCRDNWIAENTFREDELVLHLRSAQATRTWGNEAPEQGVGAVAKVLLSTPDSECSELTAAEWARAERPTPPRELRGEPFRGQRVTTGRDQILLNEWGPWDQDSFWMRALSTTGPVHAFELRGVRGPRDLRFRLSGAGVVADLERHPDGVAVLFLRSEKLGARPYRLSFPRLPAASREVRGTLVSATWRVRCFPSAVDPRSDRKRWLEAGAESGVLVSRPQLDLRWGNDGPASWEVPGAQALGVDHFGTVAETKIRFSPGRWQVSVLSDDGVRVEVGGQVVLENWTWHGPTWDHGEFTVAESGQELSVRVEHFELDGHSVLSLQWKRIE